MFAGLRERAGARAPVDTQTNPDPNTQTSQDSAATEPSGFIPATLAELSKVVWPTRQQLFSESVAVILMVGLSAAAIAAVDRFYGWTSVQVFR